jgi:hypothetical protein
MRLLIVLLFITTASFAQQKAPKVDTLKLPASEAAKIDDIEKSLKEFENARIQIQYLESMKLTIIESAFNHASKPVPEKKEYTKGVIVYIKDDKATASNKKP